MVFWWVSKGLPGPQDFVTSYSFSFETWKTGFVLLPCTLLKCRATAVHHSSRVILWCVTTLSCFILFFSRSALHFPQNQILSLSKSYSLCSWLYLGVFSCMSPIYYASRFCPYFFFFDELATYQFLFFFFFLSRMYSIYKRYENPYLSTFLGEIIGLSTLWLFWIVGTAIASVSDSFLVGSYRNSFLITLPPLDNCQSMWGNIELCQTLEACRILSALLAFSWLGWLVLSLLLGFSLLFSFANKGFMDPLHGRWNPRESRYPDTVVRA